MAERRFSRCSSLETRGSNLGSGAGCFSSAAAALAGNAAAVAAAAAAGAGAGTWAAVGTAALAVLMAEMSLFMVCLFLLHVREHFSRLKDLI